MPIHTKDGLAMEVAATIENLITEGFTPPDDVIRLCFDLYFDDYPEEILREQIPSIYEKVNRNILKKQATWPQKTNCDLLDEAFLELLRVGILAVHTCGDCRSCGFGEIERLTDEIAGKRRVQGFVFYHIQDIKRAIRTNQLYLCFGATDGTSKAMKIVGRKTVSVLNQRGLLATWSGDIDERIVLANFDWKRRWPSQYQDVVSDFKAYAAYDSR